MLFLLNFNPLVNTKQGRMTTASRSIPTTASASRWREADRWPTCTSQWGIFLTTIRPSARASSRRTGSRSMGFRSWSARCCVSLPRWANRKAGFPGICTGSDLKKACCIYFLDLLRSFCLDWKVYCLIANNHFLTVLLCFRVVDSKN